MKASIWRKKMFLHPIDDFFFNMMNWFIIFKWQFYFIILMKTIIKKSTSIWIWKKIRWCKWLSYWWTKQTCVFIMSIIYLNIDEVDHQYEEEYKRFLFMNSIIAWMNPIIHIDENIHWIDEKCSSYSRKEMKNQ